MTRTRQVILVVLRAWLLVTFLGSYGGLGLTLANVPAPSWFELPWISIDDFAVGADGSLLVAVASELDRLQLYDARGRFVCSSERRGMQHVDSVSATGDGRYLIVTRGKSGETEVDVLGPRLEPLEHLRFDGWFLVLDDVGRPQQRPPLERTGPPQGVDLPLDPGDGLSPAKEEGKRFTSLDGATWRRTPWGIRRIALDGSARTFHASWWLAPFSLPLPGWLAIVALFAHHLPGLRSPTPREPTPEEAWADHDRRQREAKHRLRWLFVGFVLFTTTWVIGIITMMTSAILGDDARPSERTLLAVLALLVLLMVALNIPNMRQWARERRDAPPPSVIAPLVREGFPEPPPRGVLLRGFLKALIVAASIPLVPLGGLFVGDFFADRGLDREISILGSLFACFVVIFNAARLLFARIDRLK